MLLTSIKRVLKQPSYLVLGVAVSVLVFFVSVLVPNFGLVRQVAFSSRVGIVYKLHFMWTLVQGLGTSVFTLTAFTTIAVAILLGINMAMLVYMIKRNKLSPQKARGKGVFSSIGGVIGGSLGIGCAACGSLILTPLLASLGATGFIAFLPFSGAEFGIVGIALLLVSIYILAKKINDPLICPV